MTRGFYIAAIVLALLSVLAMGRRGPLAGEEHSSRTSVTILVDGMMKSRSGAT
jgi:hypothetical protein